jgi:nucleotide-binding universal stress UspA family protein
MYKTILVPVDLGDTEHCRKTLGIARQFGGDRSRIVALRVAADVPALVAAELPEGLLQRNIAHARGELAKLAEEVGAVSEVRAGHPSLIILEYAKEIGADLIVVASHRPGLQDYFLGSTAARVVRHADCAVLVDR